VNDLAEIVKNPILHNTDFFHWSRLYDAGVSPGHAVFTGPKAKINRRLSSILLWGLVTGGLSAKFSPFCGPAALNYLLT